MTENYSFLHSVEIKLDLNTPSDTTVRMSSDSKTAEVKAFEQCMVLVVPTDFRCFLQSLPATVPQSS